MNLHTIAFAGFTAVSSFALAQVEINETQRYIDANTFVLNEPCINYSGVSYKGSFLLEQSGSSMTWKILNGEELTEERNGCLSITEGSELNAVHYDIANLVVSDGNVDTGRRYDALSTADATRLDLGFALNNVIESPPALVVPTSSPVPLHFTNKSYDEGLEICLGATGASSITISNDSNSVDLALSANTGTGIKTFCGNIAQDDLQSGYVVYGASINGSIEVNEAVTYWNPLCSTVQNLCSPNLDTDVVAIFPPNSALTLVLAPIDSAEIDRALVVVYNSATSEVLETIELSAVGAEFQGTYTTATSPLLVDITYHFVNKAGRESLTKKSISIANSADLVDL